MQNEVFYSDEFITSQILNQDVQNNINNFQSLTIGHGSPGLISPTAISYSVSGLNISVSLPSPFQVLFGTGILAGGYGNINGAINSTYNTSFSGVVPAPGFPAVTAYLVCTYTQIQQNPIVFIGPPPGHPDYNPNYQPYTAYTQTVDSINVFCTVAPPDNSTSFELLRCTLTSGSTGLGTTTTQYQEWASALAVLPVNILAAPGTLTPQTMNNIMVGGTYTLPNAATYNGNRLGITCNTASLVTVSSLSANIVGYFGEGAAGISAIGLAQGSSIELEAINGSWQIISGNAAGLGVPVFTFPWLVPQGGTGQTSFPAHTVLLGEGTSAIGDVGPGPYGIPLLGGGASSDPFFGAINLDSGAVTSVLQLGNGGTNQTGYAPFSVICLNSNSGQFWGQAPGSPGAPFVSNGGGSMASFQPINLGLVGLSVDGVLPVNVGGTGNTGYAAFSAICLNSNTGQLWGQPPGNVGTVLTSNGPGAMPSFQTSAGLLNVQVFNNPGTYTYNPTPGALTALVEFVGAGGGGGGTEGCGGIQWAGGGGGGGGGYVKWYGNVSSIAGQTITIGGGGGGGYNSAGGGNGGPTIFNGIGQATGGGGGSGGNSNNGSAVQFGGIGGQGSGGNLVSSAGACGNVSVGTAQQNFCAGSGGDSHFSGGGLGIIDTTSNGANGQYGSGGTGSGSAADAGGGAAQTGGNGGDGYCVIYEY